MCASGSRTTGSIWWAARPRSLRKSSKRKFPTGRRSSRKRGSRRRSSDRREEAIMQILARTLLIALSLLFTASDASAQTYPDHAIRLIVGFTPGSATDVSARMFAQKLTDAWNVPVTVENIPGAGGSVGAERVARSAPDGYTLYWGANGAMTINPSL